LFVGEEQDDLSLMMNDVDKQPVIDNEQCCVFFNQNSTLFLDQIGSRVKHKHMDRLILRTIKSHALISNLTRDNKQKELKPGKERSF
jgi:hypothetical protein